MKNRFFLQLVQKTALFASAIGIGSLAVTPALAQTQKEQLSNTRIEQIRQRSGQNNTEETSGDSVSQGTDNQTPSTEGTTETQQVPGNEETTGGQESPVYNESPGTETDVGNEESPTYNQTPDPQGTTPTEETPATNNQTPDPQGTTETEDNMGTEGSTTPTEDSQTGQDLSNSNIVAVASSNEQFQTFSQALEASGLESTLSEQGPYTVFAPTNEAFAQLPDGALELLLQPENQDLLRQVLTYHVIPGEVTSEQIQTGTVDTLGGGVAVRVDPDRIIVNNGSVIEPDIQAENGVIHAVNTVLLPPQVQEQLAQQLETQNQ